MAGSSVDTVGTGPPAVLAKRTSKGKRKTNDRHNFIKHTKHVHLAVFRGSSVAVKSKTGQQCDPRPLTDPVDELNFFDTVGVVKLDPVTLAVTIVAGGGAAATQRRPGASPVWQHRQAGSCSIVWHNSTAQHAGTQARTFK